MRKRHSKKSKPKQNSDQLFKKSLVSYVLMLIFFGFLFLRVGVPSFVFFIVAIPMTISIIHKYIDTYQTEDDTIKNQSDKHNDLDEYEDDDDWYEEPLDLDEIKSLRKEWKDSDFV